MPKNTVRISAGEHDRSDCPVWLTDLGDLPSGSMVLQPVEQGEPRAVQRVDDHLLVIMNELSGGETQTFRLKSGEPPAEGVRLVEGGETLEITAGGKPFTSYRYASEEVRPYFYPLLGPTGVAMTRSYPMLPDAAGESIDHPHHRSLYVAFGEVNGVDVWAEPPNPNTGRIVHQGWDDVFDGPAAAGFRERLQWVDGHGTPLLGERRWATVYNTASVRLLDLEIDLMPARAGVLFGDTKEGGPLAVRVASTIEGKRGGLIQNAYGGRREAETWGKRAPWVDYSGTIDGTTVGIAIMDHPTSFRHPTYWHVRDYGLFAANPFGISAFTNDPAQRGDVVLVPGQTLRFRYRVC